MAVYRRILTGFIIFIVFLLPGAVQAKVNVAKYGLQLHINVKNQQIVVADSMRALLDRHPQLSITKQVVDIEKPHVMVDKTVDFYMLLLVCMLLGVIRFLDPRYFYNLWRAFWNQTLSGRQIKEQMEGSSLSNLLMNIYFSIIAGAYIYYAGRLITPHRTGSIPPSVLVIMLILGMMLIYVAKYAVIRFSGWAFKVESITEHYVFNIFLINKMLGIVLLPFVVILAFADPIWTGPAIIVSLIVATLMLINRYTRSWQVFGSFFQYSKFHFFTYLCASELLPLAVLMKLLVRGLLY